METWEPSKLTRLVVLGGGVSLGRSCSRVFALLEPNGRERSMCASDGRDYGCSLAVCLLSPSLWQSQSLVSSFSSREGDLSVCMSSVCPTLQM